jgi:hypothetical protein
MKNISYELKKEANGNCTISGNWNYSSATFHCEIDNNIDGNDSAVFLLKINGGQVEKGEIQMCGPLERQEFIETLELILRELKG